MAQSNQSAGETQFVPSEHIERPRLSGVLNQSQRRVLWLVGPLGSGKSALAREYCELSGQPLIWHGFRSGEQGAGELLGKIALAVGDDSGKPRGGSSATVLTLFKSVAESYGQPWTLCLDGYELLGNDSELHNILADVAAYAGDLCLTIIVTSRITAPQQWSKIVANRQLEVCSDFSFDREELSRIVTAYPTFEKHTDAWLQDLLTLSAGWPAGVVLLLEHLQVGLDDGIEPKLTDAGLQATAGYFQHNYFSSLPDDVKQLLLRASLIPILPVDGVAEVLDHKEAERLLTQLCNDRTYISLKNRVFEGAGESPQSLLVYGCQPMFLAFIRQRAQSELSATDRRAIVIRGAQQLALSDDFLAAVELYSEYDCRDEIAALILANALSLTQTGHEALLESAFNHLPSAVIAASADLLLWRGICATSLGDVSARLYLSQAYGLYREQANSLGMALSWRAVVDAIWLSWDGLDELGDWLAEYDARAEAEFKELPEPFQSGMMMSRFGILSFWSPDHPDLPELEDRIVEYVHDPMSIQERALLFVKMLHHFTYGTGNRAQTDFYLNVMRTYMKREASSPLDRVLLDNFEAAYQYCFEGSPQSCYDFAESALTTGDDAGIEIWHSVSLTHGLYMALGQGDIKRAKQYIARFKMTIGLNNFMHLAFDELFSAWLAILEGRHTSAMKHIEAGLVFFERNPVPMIRNLFLGGKAALLIQQGQWKSAWSVLSEIRRFASRARSNTFEIMVRLFQAHWCLKRKRYWAARAFLKRAGEIGAAQNIFVCPWLHPSTLPNLVGFALESGLDRSYFSRWVSLYCLKVPAGVTTREHWPWRIKIKTLGAFEIRLNDQLLEFSNKSHKRLLGVLGILITAGPNGIVQGALIQELWPNKREDQGRSNLNTNLARLRTFLGEADSVTSSEGRVTLSPEVCWIDSWEFLAASEPSRKGNVDINHFTAMENLYAGEYAVMDGGSGAVSMQRMTLAGRYMDLARTLARSYEGAEAYSDAIAIYRNMLVKLLPEEVIYRDLMVCYAKTNRLDKVSAVYSECEIAILRDYDAALSDETTRCYQLLVNPG